MEPSPLVCSVNICYGTTIAVYQSRGNPSGWESECLSVSMYVNKS